MVVLSTPGLLSFIMYNGTVSTPTAGPSANIAQINFNAHDGTQELSAALIVGGIVGTASTNNMPGYMSFLTNPGSGGDPILRMHLHSDGNVGIGTGLDGLQAPNVPGALLDLGRAGFTLGTMRMAGNTSGNVTLQPAAAAGTWTLTLPTTDGNANDVLTTDGAGVTSWAAINPSTPVSSITGTANQVIRDVGIGDVALSLPQDIHTGATPQFAGLGLGTTASSGNLSFGGTATLSTTLFPPTAGPKP